MRASGYSRNTDSEVSVNTPLLPGSARHLQNTSRPLQLWGKNPYSVEQEDRYMSLPVRNFLFAAFMSSIFVSARPATAQSADDKATGHTQHELVKCPDSPTPGKRPDNMECAVLAHTRFTKLPTGPLFLRLATFSTKQSAHASSTPSSALA